MSTTVDSRVVEMRFDNQHFEKNVQTSLSTLEKLKLKLNLTGASKGLEDIDKAARGTNIGALGTAAQAVGHKFSAMQIAGITAIANITNSAVNAGKRMVKSLTVDPVKAGWSEYELKMGSIQTIMASTGESLETVNGYLNDLNEYSDKTIYSFSDMTQNIGKFTNAGVKLEDAVLAIKGISNEAAVSGANANEASRAMYNFAQALSAGHVKLMDWKSIENANMATVEFKNQLIESAVNAGTLKKAGEGLYTTLEGKTISATKNFNESLQDQWMTSDVLIGTLKKYADETTAIGKKATNAATEVKTFSQMMDSLRESAQSGWATTWEILFGDFEEGKTLWTNISKAIDGVIGKISDLRNNILEGAFSSPWKKVSETIEDAGYSTDSYLKILEETLKKNGVSVKDLEKKYGSLTKAIKKGKVSSENITEALKEMLKSGDGAAGSIDGVVGSMEDLDKVVKQVIRGEWDNGKKRMDELTESGYTYAQVQNKVNEVLGSSVRHAYDQADATGKVTKKQAEQISSLARLSDAQLKQKGYTDKQIKALRELQAAAKGTDSDLNDLIANLERPTGRDLLIESFSHVFGELGKIFDAVKESFQNVFGEVNVSEALYTLIENFYELTTAINFSEERVKQFETIMNGLWTGFKLGGTLVSRSLYAGIKIFDAFLGLFNADLWTLGEWISEKLIAFDTWINERTMFGWDTGYDKIATALKAVYEGLKKCFKAFVELERVQKAIQYVKDALTDLFGSAKGFIDFFSIEGVVESITSIFDKVEAWIKGMDASENIGMYIVDGLVKGMTGAAKGIFNAVVKIATAIFDAFCSFFQINSPSRLMMTVGGFIVAGLIYGITHGFGDIGATFGTMFSKMVTNGEKIFTSLWAGLKIGYGKVKTFLSPFLLKIQEIFTTLDFGSLVAVGIGLSTMSLFKNLNIGVNKLGDSLGILAEPFKLVGEAAQTAASAFSTLTIGLGKTLTAFRGNLHSKSIKNLAIALAILVGSLIALTYFVDDTDKMWQAIAILGALTVILIGLAAASALMSSASVSLSKAGLSLKGLNMGLIGMGITILLLAATVKMIGNLNPEQARQGFLGLVLAIGAFVVLMGALAGVSMLAKNVAIAKVGTTLIAMSIAMLLMIRVVKSIGKLSEDEINVGTRAIMGFIGIIALLGTISRLSGGLRNIGGTMMAISASLLLMIVCAKLIAGMEWQDMTKAAVGILGFIGIVTMLALISNLDRNMYGKVGTTMLGLSGSMVFLAIALRILGGMEWGNIGKAAVGLMALVSVVAMLVVITNLAGKDAVRMGLTLMAMSISIGILAAVAVVLGMIKLENLAKGIVAVSMLGVVVAGIVAASKGATDIRGTMIGIAAAIGVMAISLAALSFIKWEKLLPATVSLGSVMLALASVAKSASGLGKGAIVPIIMMSVMIGLIAFVIKKLSDIPVENALGAAASLAILLVALSKSMTILGKATVVSPKAYISLGVMLLAMGALAGILYLIRGMPVESTLANTLALSTLLVVMSVVIHILNGIGVVSPMALVAAGAMTIVVGALAGILYLMKDMPVKSTLANVTALSTMLIALSAACVILGVVGLMGPAAFIGIAALATLVVGMGAIITGIGALVSKFPQLEEFLDKGIPIMEKIGTAIGSFFGGIVGGFTSGVTSALPDMAADLSLFMLNLTPFITGAKMIDDAAITGVKNIAKMVAYIGGASFLDGLSEKFGGTSMADLGTNLADFGQAIVDFSEIVGDKVNEKSVTAAINAAKMLAEIQAITTVTDVISAFTGVKGLDTFGTQLQSFGTAIVGFSETVSADGAVSPSAIETAATAGKLMAELQKSVAPGLGVATIFTGQKNLGQFGEQLKAFGEAVVAFSDTVDGKDSINLEAAEKAKAAGIIMTELQAALPKSNGIAQAFAGEKSLTNFGEQLKSFGSAIVAFSDTIDGEDSISLEAAEKAKAAGLIMTALQTALPKSNGIAQIFSGEQNLTTFGSQLTAFGEAIVGFSKAVSGEKSIDLEAIKTAKQAGMLMATLQEYIPKDKWFDGTVSLDEFGRMVTKFGGCIADFSTEVAGVDGEAINRSLDATKQLVNITRTLGTVKAENIDNFTADELGDALKDYSDNVADIDQAAITNSVSATRQIISIINSLANLDTSGVSSFKNAVSSLAKTNVSGIADSFSSSAKQLSSVGGDLAVNIGKGISANKGAITGAAKSVMGTLEQQMASGSGSFQKAGTAAMNKFAAGLAKSATTVANNAKAAALSAVSRIRLCYSNFYNAGSYVVSGFANGISANTWRAEAKAKAMAKAAEKAAKKALDEHSPSRVFYKIGDYAGLGFVNALSDHASTAYSASTVMADSARQGLSDAMSKVNNILSGDMDVQPTIRPVLDLSDVRSGAGAINGLLGNGVTVGAMANVNAIGSMMNQNGQGDDVVSAINRLRKDLGNLGNTTYNVNGITYDDGSNVSNAVKDIIRHTRIEGRV